MPTGFGQSWVVAGSSKLGVSRTSRTSELAAWPRPWVCILIGGVASTQKYSTNGVIDRSEPNDRLVIKMGRQIYTPAGNVVLM